MILDIINSWITFLLLFALVIAVLLNINFRELKKENEKKKRKQ